MSGGVLLRMAFAVAALSGTAVAVCLASTRPPSPPRADGATVYAAYCALCHGTVGQGAERAGPPLVSNQYVRGDPKRLIGTILRGMTGSISVNGKPWGHGTMPPLRSTLSNDQVAAVVSFIRHSWGNRASSVSERDVADSKM